MASAPNFILFMCDSLPVACKWQCSGTPKRVVSECDGHGAQLIASSRAPPGLLSANAQPTKHGTSLNTPAWVQEHLLLYNGVGRRKNDGCRRKTKGGKKHRDVVEGLSQGDDGNDAAATTDAASLDATTKMFHGFFRLAASQRAERRNQQLYPFSRRRCIALEGMTNLRNLGGYHTKDGERVTKWGVLYRGDQPSAVPPDVAQQVLVQKLHIHHIFDLRDDAETKRKSYAIPHTCRRVVPIDMSRMGELLSPDADAKAGPVAFRLMQDYYRRLVTVEGPTVGAIIKGFLSTKPSPNSATIFHCTAGKDRTGWVVYTLLSLLGVTEEEMRADYELTNDCFKIPKEAYEYEGAAGLSEGAMKAYWRASIDYIDAAMEEVNRLGGMEAYAMSHMGLTHADIQQLRDVMLE